MFGEMLAQLTEQLGDTYRILNEVEAENKALKKRIEELEKQIGSIGTPKNQDSEQQEYDISEVVFPIENEEDFNRAVDWMYNNRPKTEEGKKIYKIVDQLIERYDEKNYGLNKPGDL